MAPGKSSSEFEAVDQLRKLRIRDAGYELVTFADYCDLLLSRTAIVRLDEQQVGLLALHELNSGRRFVIERERVPGDR